MSARKAKSRPKATREQVDEPVVLNGQELRHRQCLSSPEGREAAMRMHGRVGAELIRACDAISEVLAELEIGEVTGEFMHDRMLELNAILWRARWNIFVDSGDVRAAVTSKTVMDLLFGDKPADEKAGVLNEDMGDG